MKFSNGGHLTREGVTLYRPVYLFDSAEKDGALWLYGSFNPISHRANTIDQGMLTYKLSSPMEGVLHIEAWHFRGVKKRGPEFKNADCGFTPEISVTDEESRITSGSLSAYVKKGTAWSLVFERGGKPLTSSPAGAAAYADAPEGRFMREQLTTAVGEHIYGFGERFTAFVKNGQTVDTWNADGGTYTSDAYKCVPFYMTDGGYGVYVNNPGRVSFEVGSEYVNRVSFSVPGEKIDYYIIDGPSPKEVLKKYTALTGRAPRLPAWSFGLWLTTSFTTNYDEQTVNSFIDGMEERRIPLSVFHFDCFWMREVQWCDFEWDKRVFPDPEGMLKRLKEKGLHICVWINPYISSKSPLFDEGAENGYLLKRPNGDVWEWDLWQAGMGYVDFTNPDACAWYRSKLERLLDMGVDCFKTDFGERIPIDVEYYDGSDPEKMHNYYSYLYNKLVFDLLREKRGEGEAVVFARSATAGGQQFPVHWGGDCESNFGSMAESMRAGLSMMMSGFGYWSHDISGFEDTASPEVYKRWLAFGIFSSHSRLHGNMSYRVPWLFGDEAVAVAREFSRLKCRLMPYIYSMGMKVSSEGTPIMRPMVLEFPDDPGTAYLDRQYMYGDNLLVAPIFNDEGDVTFYVPEAGGLWTDFLTGKTYEGGKYYSENCDFFHLPLLARPGAIIPVGANAKKPDYDYADGIVYNAFPTLEGESSAEVYDTEGKLISTVKMTKCGKNITFSADTEGVWGVLLHGVHEAASASCPYSAAKQGILLDSAGSTEITIELP